MESNKENLIRQGDLLFVPVEVEGTAKYIRSTFVKGGSDYRKDGIIQEGEATGHHHRLADPTMGDVFRPRFGGVPIIITGDRGASVTHEEHKPVALAPDTVYQVHIAREFDPTGQIRQVVD